MRGGMSTRDIQDLLRQKYAIEISPQFVSDVCAAVSAGVAEWRERPLPAVWPIVYLYGLHLKVRDGRRVVGKALYAAVGLNLAGQKNYWASGWRKAKAPSAGCKS